MDRDALMMVYAWSAIAVGLIPLALRRLPRPGPLHHWHSRLIGPAVLLAAVGAMILANVVGGAIDVAKGGQIHKVLAALAALPLQLALFLVVNRLAATPARFAERHRRWLDILTLSARLWIVATPAVFLIHAAAISLVPLEDHPLILLMRGGSPFEQAALAASACVAAPVLEEFFFRGILLPWLLQGEAAGAFERTPRPMRCRLVLGVAAFFALTTVANDAPPARKFGSIAFVFAAGGCVELLPRWRWLCRRIGLPPFAMRAVAAQAALFGAVHSGVWPTPVPLFLLGAVLGWLAVRTRSVWPAMAFHALFNLVSTAATIFGAGPATQGP